MQCVCIPFMLFRWWSCVSKCSWSGMKSLSGSMASWEISQRRRERTCSSFTSSSVWLTNVWSKGSHRWRSESKNNYWEISEILLTFDQLDADWSYVYIPYIHVQCMYMYVSNVYVAVHVVGLCIFLLNQFPNWLWIWHWAIAHIVPNIWYCEHQKNYNNGDNLRGSI